MIQRMDAPLHVKCSLWGGMAGASGGIMRIKQRSGWDAWLKGFVGWMERFNVREEWSGYAEGSSSRRIWIMFR